MNPECLQTPWSYDEQNVLSALGSSKEKGLSDIESQTRLEKYGPNVLHAQTGRGWLLVLISQFKSILVMLLVFAGGLAFAFHDWIEGIAICIVILINAGIGFFTEWSAIRSMNSLRKFSTTQATIKRSGVIKKIPSEELVPGDIAIINAGDIIAADMRILTSSQLQINESLLTGESFPVAKHLDTVKPDTMLAERANMLYKGTSITRGNAEAIVVTTGLDTELGNISSLVTETEDETTPLEKRLSTLGKKLIVVTLAVTAFTLIAGLFSGKDTYLMVKTSIALAVAAIPEGLPIIATLALARGMWRMAQHNALVNKLSAVEALGATNLICTDKTGTLTENKMHLARVVTNDNDCLLDEPGSLPNDIQHALSIGTLCNKASLEQTAEEKGGIGDPIEIAILAAANKANISQKDLLKESPLIKEQAFDSEIKMMGTVHQQENHILVAVKGAAEAVLKACTQIREMNGSTDLSAEKREHWLNKNNELASSGYRVLALANKTAGSKDDEFYESLTFLGLACFIDPPREDIMETLIECHHAGIRIIMITGDQIGTATHVAKTVGIIDSKSKGNTALGKDIPSLIKNTKNDFLTKSIFARVSPKDKLDIIQAHQQDGSIVAMTGDGVNDAPALKKADIGIAMGIRGTEIAREASDMVLRDDSFTTIVAAIKQGRIIFNNIRKFVIYLMSCNLSEIFVLGIAAGINAPLPLLPLQILFLNLVTDVFPALALGASEGNDGVMRGKPRKIDDALIGRKEWLEIVSYSMVISFSVLSAFAVSLLFFKVSTNQAITTSFLILAISQIFHVFNMAERKSHPLLNEVTQNHVVWAAVVLCLALLASALLIPIFSETLSLEMPDKQGWIIITIASAIPITLGRIISFINYQSRQSSQTDQTILAHT